MFLFFILSVNEDSVIFHTNLSEKRGKYFETNDWGRISIHKFNEVEFMPKTKII